MLAHGPTLGTQDAGTLRRMPSTETSDDMGRMIDHAAIMRLQARYADIITRRRWDELEDLFTEGMPLHLDTVTAPAQTLSGAREVGEFIGSAVERFDFFGFQLLNAVVELYPDGDRDAATARFWMCEVRCAGTDEDGRGGEWSNAYGLYRDTYRRQDGRWWFANRRYRSLARTGEESIVLPFPDLS